MAIKLFVIILVVFLGGVSCLIKAEEEEEQLPEYSEYLQRLGVKRAGKTTKPPIQMLGSDTGHHWPSISLCKERPADGDYYGHVFCWTMVALFAMTIISLIIYQLRSLLWLRLAIISRRSPHSRSRQSAAAAAALPHQGTPVSYISFAHNGQSPADKHLTF